MTMQLTAAAPAAVAPLVSQLTGRPEQMALPAAGTLLQAALLLLLLLLLKNSEGLM